MLADPSVDIVHVGTPPFLHGPMARRAAERGKHVFVEKPLATTVAEAQAAMAAALDHGVRLTIDYVLRQHPLHRLAIALTRSGALGHLQQFALENFASAENLPAEHWFWDPSRSGGIHVEHGVHFFDLCFTLLGVDADVVTATAHRRSDGRVDRVSALLGFGDRAVASFYHSFNRTGPTERTTIRLAFRDGHVIIDGWIPTRLEMEGAVAPNAVAPLTSLFGDSLRIADAGRSRASATIPVNAVARAPDREHEYRLAVRAGMADLIAAIDGVRPLQVTASDGLHSLEVAIRATL
jgi:predicted dehydrogenase